MNTYQGRHRTPGRIISGYKITTRYNPRHAAPRAQIRTNYGVGAVTTRRAA